MKILVLCNKFPYPPKDGGSIATLNMMEGLQASGNDVSCLALNTAKHLSIGPVGDHRHLSQQLVRDNILVSTFRCGSGDSRINI